MNISKQKQQDAFKTLQKDFGYTSPMRAPRITKVIVSTGVGKKRDKKVLEVIADRLSRITGQKAAPRAAKLSIASFKVREGDVVGYQVTLRGARMYDFLDRLVNIALPRVRDFRGLNPKSFDGRGNYTLGLKEHIIFPEIDYDKVEDVLGMDIVVCTTARNDDEARALLQGLNFPFRS